MSALAASPSPVSAPVGSLLELLGVLGKLGPNLPAFMAFAQTVLQAWNTLQNAMTPTTIGRLFTAALSPDEARGIAELHLKLKPKLVTEFAKTLGGHPAMLFGDAHLFASVFALAKAHPVLLQIMLHTARGMLPAA
jgi:hypothetical protein